MLTPRRQRGIVRQQCARQEFHARPSSCFARGALRFVLRVSQTQSAAQACAEHRILRRLRPAGHPFQVPEPVAAPSGDTAIETAAGPATVCRWISGVQPDLTSPTALERFGRAAGLLGEAMLGLPPEDGLGDRRGNPLAHPAVPHVGALCRQLQTPPHS
ncbi:phosphotransferase [Nonomuraea sp. NPDC050404]|uniref:phosphotransferase n=1 Tax=Nonomuraea sp. NPDC050404 TaxID=3155783 RepID=UPI0033C05AA6